MAHSRPNLLQTLTLMASTSVVMLLLFILRSQAQQPSRPLLNSSSPVQLMALLGLFQNAEPPEGEQDGGSRPDSPDYFCAIAPFAMPDTATVWSHTPTLTWQSPPNLITKVEISPRDNRHDPWVYDVSEENVVRTDTRGDLTLNTYQLTLDQPLDPGATYEWRVYQRVGNFEEISPRFFRFQIMEAAERERLTASLQELEATLVSQRSSSEATTVERANFFAQEGLWADAWEVALSADTPSEELDGAIAETLNTLCALPNE